MKPSILVCQKCHRARMGNSPEESDTPEGGNWTPLWCYCPECRETETQRIMMEFRARQASQGFNLEITAG